MVVMTMWLPRFACRDEGPGGAKQAGTHHGHRHGDIPGDIVVERQRNQRAAETAKIRLPFRTDVEQASMNGDRNGEAGEDEARRIIERKTNAFAAAECALDQQRQGRKRAFADQPDDEAGDQEGDDEVQNRDEAVIDPVW